jgi:hypothetical protein
VDKERLRSLNAAIAEEFRANAGRVARFPDREILLLTTTGAEHDRLYTLFTSQLSGTDEHQSRTTRTIPMVVLERTAS